jgi:hypothetical protein
VKTESFVKRTDSLSRFFGKSQQKSPPNGSKWHFPAVKAGMRPDRKNPPVFPFCTIPNTAKTCFFAGITSVLPAFRPGKCSTKLPDFQTAPEFLKTPAAVCSAKSAIIS